MNNRMTSFDALPEFCSPAEIAPILSVSRATAYRMAASGKLPCLRLGKRVIISKVHLVEWVDRTIREHMR